MSATTGTKTAAILNLLGSLFAAIDPGVLAAATGAGGAKWAVMGVFLVNTILHAFTGNTPMVGTNT